MQNKKYIKNIKPFTCNIQQINKLKPIEFTWKQNNDRDIGLLVKDVQKICPKITHIAKHGQTDIKYDKITLLLVNTVQDMHKSIECLKKDVAKLKRSKSRNTKKRKSKSKKKKKRKKD